MAFVPGAIRPFFRSFSMLLILVPLAGILGSRGLRVCTLAMGSSIQKVALVNVTVAMFKPSVAVELSSFPIAGILGTILPNLHAISVRQSTLPLAFV